MSAQKDHTGEIGKEIYLGDGLYCHFDGYGFWLRAPRNNGDHEVYLEGQTLINFLDHLENVKRAVFEDGGKCIVLNEVTK